MNALRAVGWLTMAVCASSCLVTDALEVEPVVPPPANHPVAIAEDSVSPKNWALIQVTRASTPPCTQTFRVGQVTDEDIADNLAARWFMDCPDVPSGPGWRSCQLDSSGEYDIPLFSSDSDPVSRIGPSLENRKFTSPGLHIIKLLVSDGFAPGLPVVNTGRSLASYEWAVVVASDCGEAL